MHPGNGTQGCAAILLGMNGKRTGELCGCNAAFESRGHACCWVHFQADTKGQRAGKVKFREAKR